MTPADTLARRKLRYLGLIGGPVAALVLVVALPDAEIPATEENSTIVFGAEGRAVLGLMAWMAIWWLTEAIDVAATALLPVALLPLGTRTAFDSAGDTMAAAAAPYAHPSIALFLGGFMIALAMERWGLHRRIALTTLRLVGTSPRRIIAGFMAITAILSMWVSNTATTVMMLPIALSVLGLVAERRVHFALCLLLGIAYAASVGGIGTLIGTPPNLLLAGFLERTYGIELSFVRWLAVGLPLVVVFVPIIWFVLTRFVYRVDPTPIEGGRALIRQELDSLGPMKRAEWSTMIVFVLTAAAWISRPLLVDLEIAGTKPLSALTDPGIAMIAALSLFVIPAGRGAFVMNWDTARRLPWGILILFGGGLSLAAAVKRHGVADFIGYQAQALEGVPTVLVIVLVTTGVIFLTELTSNTATTATLLPLLASVAPALGIEPMLLLVSAVIAASCAFMMPVATPPNAIVFGSGRLTIPQMCRAGILLNVIGIVLVTILAYAVVMPILVR
ncbi:MAG: DASS family sodium-coupled anion symporter [Planctomycetes bacterium]|nr:DASS family sodium-coupled anion symporter [Planctomycetota bacterium]